jgi:hypothetical protein
MLITILAIVTSTATAANFVHWCLRGYRFVYWPTGAVGVLVNILLVTQLVLAVLVLGGIVFTILFWLVVGSYTIIADVYSIRRRQQLGLGTTGRITKRCNGPAAGRAFW